MQLCTQLDVDLVAVEADDEVILLVEVTAPSPASTAPRRPATVQIVLDRSGSMSGGRLDHAKRALLELIDRLEPSDNVGVVAFDGQVQVVVPAGPLTEKARAKLAIAAVISGGSTDLSAGYLRGLQEAQRVAGPGGATVLLISDGHANTGITEPGTLAGVASKAAVGSVTTSTVGMGLGYDEQLLAAVATAGRGNEHFAEEADTAAAVIAGEVDGLLTQVAQACSLRVALAPEVKGAQLLNQLPVAALPDGFMVELGSLYAGETRRLVLRLALPGLAALGLHQVATLTFTHVSLPDVVRHTTMLPVTVNVVPGDQAAGRVRSPQVTKEALFQETQRTKKNAADLLSDGRVEEARAMLTRAGSALNAEALSLPEVMAAELHDEVRLLLSLAEESGHDSMRTSKALSSDFGWKSRTRGRQVSGSRLLLVAAGDDEIDGLTLDRWRLTGLARLTPSIAAVRAGADLEPSLLAAIADELGLDHNLHAFFVRAAAAGGLRVTRV